MPGELLLDTNIVIGLFADDEIICRRLVEAPNAMLSSIAVGELCYGARKSRQVEENLAKIGQLVAGMVVLACDLETAFVYSLIKNELRAKGHPLPENDIWMAAIARQYGLRLISRDRRFAEIDSLDWEPW
jgi:tRNA(fMet)-specific endonuclease VapC